MAEPVALVTGASRGIGAALAHVFADNGHAVALTARSVDGLDATADAIAAKGHARPAVIVADIGTAEGVTELADALAARGLEPSFLVNNAGFGLLGAAANANLSDQLAMIDLNARALTDLTLRFSESLARHRGGVLNVASIAAFAPGPGMAVYHATKAYVLSLTEALHQEFANDGVRVCALCPGPADTGFYARGGIPGDYFPSVLIYPVDDIARAGYDGMMGGHRVVVPGKPNRIFSLLPRLLPRGLMLLGMTWRFVRARRLRR